jgi:hypothetical protein
VRLEGLGQLKKKNNYLVGNRTRDIPACRILSQPTTLPRAPGLQNTKQNYKSEKKNMACLSQIKYTKV